MDIYWKQGGVYRCINNPDNKRKYVLLEAEGCYPTHVPVADSAAAAGQGSGQPRYRTAVPIPCFSEADHHKKPQSDYRD